MKIFIGFRLRKPLAVVEPHPRLHDRLRLRRMNSRNCFVTVNVLELRAILDFLRWEFVERISR